MEVRKFDFLEKKFGLFELESDIWNFKFNPLLISLYNRYILLNRRRVISKTKNKSEVSGGGRKPWRQKGTGRARQGSIRSPQWKGGGVVFGPNGEQNYSININKKEKRTALFSILSKKASQNEIVVVENIKFNDYKTKEAFSLVENLQAFEKKIVFIMSLLEEKNDMLKKSFKNIDNIDLSNSARIDVPNIIKSNLIIFTKDAILELENFFIKKNDKR